MGDPVSIQAIRPVTPASGEFAVGRVPKEPQHEVGYEAQPQRQQRHSAVPEEATKVSAAELRNELQRAKDDLNQLLLKVNQRLSFRIHEGSERMTVQVIDNATNEVVREVPPEAFLDTIAKVREYIGLLFDDWV